MLGYTEFFARFRKIKNLEHYFTRSALACSKYSCSPMGYFLRELSVDENMVHIREVSDAIDAENKAMQKAHKKQGGR